MKRFGFKEVKELIENDRNIYIRLDTMPFTTIYPLYAVMRKENIANDHILGFMTSQTFYKLTDNKIIEFRRSTFCYDIYY